MSAPGRLTGTLGRVLREPGYMGLNPHAAIDTLPAFAGKNLETRPRKRGLRHPGPGRFGPIVPPANRAQRIRPTVLASIGLTVLLSVAGCHSPTNTDPQPTPAPPNVTFEDVTQRSALVFTQTNGAAGDKLLPEAMGSGCAFLDFDNDGWQDILLVNGKSWTSSRKRGGATLKLFRNDRHGRFVDVTKETGLDIEMYGMGVAVGDFDNDGYDDLFVTGVGGCKLFHNVPVAERYGRGSAVIRRFEDATTRAGVSSPGWATSATWLDYNRDGRLDLFVCHYVKWSPEANKPYSADNVHRTYSNPEQYSGETCRLYRNEGAGRFKDVTREAGIVNDASKALGVVAFDFDQDGLPDILVANDTTPNLLYHNQGDGTFKEVAVEMGVAVSEQGKAKAGMGVDCGDDRNDGQESILVTNFSGEQFTLYRKESTGHYLDEAARSGIGNASQYFLGFGAFFFDYDGDGRQDIFVANGHIQSDVEARQPDVVYREPALLLRNTGNGQFVNATAETGQALQTPMIGRGTAWGDFDNDGHPDILITSNFGDPTSGHSPSDGRARLLRNANRTGNNWIRFRLEGVKSNRDAYGARVRIRAGGLTQTHSVKCASSYLSQSDRRLLFGVGKSSQVEAIEIQWPSGQVQTLGPVEANRSFRIREGGIPLKDVAAR